MCGIAGSLNMGGVGHALRQLLHRGPDSHGEWQEGNIHLIHTRLAILDLSPTGHQPMEFENLVITFNGEIYNYISIREQLIAKGYTFVSKSDTEVVLKGFHCWGEGLVKELNGMFAFVIYNKSSKEIFAARDHIGIKPFYYYHNQDQFAFGSELKALPEICRSEKDDKSVIQFLSLSYIPAPSTLYKNVYKLEPGCMLTFHNGKLTIKRYWDINDRSTYSSHFTFDNYDEVLQVVEEQIIKSVKMQLVADVSVGSFLSGGIDSSLVTALAQQVSSSPINTYSMGFPEKKFDESEYAVAIAQHLKTDHTNLTFTHNDLIRLLDRYDYYFDEPFGDSASLPLSILCQKAKQVGLTVALTGDGGDELFLGYTRYTFATNYYNKFKKIPFPFNKAIATALAMTGKDKAIKMKYPIANPSLLNFYTLLYTAIKPWDLPQAFDQAFLKQAFDGHKPHLWDLLNIKQRGIKNELDLSNIDIERNLPDDMLTKSDRASMRFSMELRVPLLDKDVAELSRQIPLEFLLKEGRKKSILKDILAKYVPEALTERPKKGFGVPIEIWFRNELRDEVLDIAEVLPEFINKTYVSRIIDEHLHKNRNHSYILWNLMRLNKFYGS